MVEAASRIGLWGGEVEVHVRDTQTVGQLPRA